MARNWTLQFEPRAMDTNSPSVAGSPSFLDTTLRPSVILDQTTDQSVVLEGIVPDEYTGRGTLKLAILYGGNTTSTTLDARIDVVTEFRTPGAAENLNADNYDATPDSDTLLFSATAYSLQTKVIPLTPVVTPAIGDKFRIKVTRDADNASNLDDFADKLHIVGAEFYEEI